jgi:XTP/dITP diphosphohydrolase
VSGLRLVVASGNAKKRAELERLLASQGVSVLGPGDVGGLPEVVEDQPSFRANAEKKASSAARWCASWTLADDSGLEVEALDGAPGVRSARWAGEPHDDAANNAKLLRALRGLPKERRRARFVCVLALARPDGSIAASFEGVTHGRILEAPRGSSGFGYDPLFLYDEPGNAEAGRTFAELSTDAKGRVSHRGRALRALCERLPELLQPPTDRSSSSPWNRA